MRRTVFSLMFSFVFHVSICFAQVIVDPTPEVALKGWDTKSIAVPPGASSTLIEFSVDPDVTGGDLFDIVTYDAGIVISLILPSGTEVTADNASALGFEYTIIPDGTPNNVVNPLPFTNPGTHTLIKLPPSSPAGTYQVKANSSASVNETVMIISYFSSSPIRAGLLVDSPVYRIGETVVLSGLVFNGSSPISNANVSASIGIPSDLLTPPETVNLQDAGPLDAAAGDGIYTGTYTATRAGEFSAAIKVTGTTGSGVPYSRTATTTFRVNPALARLASFSDTGLDDDGNGSLDRVVVTANVDVQGPGKYFFVVSLLANNGEEIQTRKHVDLEAGVHPVDVTFSAQELLSLATDGPYVISNASLSFEGIADTTLTADFRENAGNTSAYVLSSFDRGPVFFTGQNDVVGVDTNGNGKFDLLRIQAGLNTSNGGIYHWSGILRDQLGRQIEFFSKGDGSLSAGDNSITFEFNGSKISQNGVDGPYTLDSVDLFWSGPPLINKQLLQTPAFSASKFEGASQSPVVHLSITNLSFGNQNVGTTSSLQMVTLTNTGTGPLAITSITAGGDFAQSNTCGSSVVVGGNCTLNVTFSPTTTGARTGSITLTDDASNSPQVVTLSGTGVAPAVTLSSASLTFANQNVNSTSAPQSLTLSNTGTAPLSISAIVVRGDFAQRNNCGGSVAAGAICTVNVTFTPTTAGSRTGTLKFTDNASNSPQTVSLIGTGIASDTISPVFEGWYKNRDGTFTLSFGYLNRNNGTVQIPVGANNFFTLRPQDRGQTTAFVAGWQRRAFNVIVPANFSGNLVWTLAFAGSRKTSTGSLDPALQIQP